MCGFGDEQSKAGLLALTLVIGWSQVSAFFFYCQWGQ